MHQLKTFRTNSPNSLKAPAREMTDFKKTNNKNKTKNYITPSLVPSRKERPEKEPQMLSILICKAMAVWHNIPIRKARKTLQGLREGFHAKLDG